MSFQKLLSILLISLIIISCTDGEVIDSSLVVAEHPIEIRMVEGEAKFWNKIEDKEFVLRGVNYFWIVPTSTGFQDRFFAEEEFDATRIRSDFKNLVAYGYNTIRIFLDTCNDGVGCIGNLSGSGLNAVYIDNIVRTIEIANEEGIYLILTSNDLPDSGGYSEISNAGASELFAGYRNAHYLTPQGIESAQKYWNDLIKAIYSSGAPLGNVLSWSILNEQWYFREQPPFSLSTGMVTTANGNSYDMTMVNDKKRMAVEGMIYYIDKVRESIDKFDPNALVTMGFITPSYPNPIGVGDFRYVETADLLTSANLDFFDFHAYPGHDLLEPQAENFGMIGYNAKPIIMGEYGTFLSRYSILEEAVITSQAWVAESCIYGFDGWLYWGMYRAPIGIGDATWGFKDDSNQMLKGLSPLKISNPCNEDLLPPTNLALNKTVTVSRSISGELPEMAVDGSYLTQWGSGQHPPQWIEIDLEADLEISKINMHVAQFPIGFTSHILEAKNSTGSWVHLNTFTGTTSEDDVLEHTFLPGTFYRYIKITTTEGPSWVSWKEIEIYN